MRLFLYEYTCAVHASSGLHAEGLAMLRAVGGDFALLPGVDIQTLADESLATTLGFPCAALTSENEEAAFRGCAADADYTLVIAPECDDILATRCRWVDEAGGKLLGPSVEAVEICGDKLRLSRLWQDARIATPATWESAAAVKHPFPLVCKPRSGAGAQATFVVPSESCLTATLARARAEMPGDEFILQPLVPGQPASVSFLIGPRTVQPLVPALQRLSSDGRLKYLGGRMPLAPDLAARATRLATRALSVVPGLCGYVGVDLILGPAADGSHDRAIEINPRLTTSYLGLRRLAQFNLAHALLQAVRGEEMPPRHWQREPIEFAAASV